MAKKIDPRFVGCTWTEIDTSTLTGQVAKDHEQAEKDRKVANASQGKFNASFCASLAAMVPAGHEMVVSRQWGKLNFTIVTAKPKGRSAKAVSYLDVLAAFTTKKA